MSTHAFDQLRSQIMILPESERAELAHDLIKSLDAPNDHSVSNEWELELKNRIAQIDTGTAKFVDRDTFRERMISKIKGL
ncbi:addiction module protein [Marinomonas polaris]|uniref:addiction module protein n=1 Tax=Marinomonas polaris TaxID=293552 RepID=UPI003515EC09